MFVSNCSILFNIIYVTIKLNYLFRNKIILWSLQILSCLYLVINGLFSPLLIIRQIYVLFSVEFR